MAKQQKEKTAKEKKESFDKLVKVFLAPKAKMKVPTDFNGWIEAIKRLDTTKNLIKLQAEFDKDLSVVPNDKIGEVLNAFDAKADELEHFGK